MIERLVVMGRIAAPYGINGWIRIQPFTQQQQNLLDYSRWQVGREDAWQLRTVEVAKVHGAAVVAKLEGVADREQAAVVETRLHLGGTDDLCDFLLQPQHALIYEGLHHRNSLADSR